MTIDDLKCCGNCEYSYHSYEGVECKNKDVDDKEVYWKEIKYNHTKSMVSFSTVCSKWKWDELIAEIRTMPNHIHENK